MENKTLPCDIEAEQKVLGAMLKTDGGIDAIATVRTILKPADFYQTYHQRIYSAILELADTGIPTDDLEAAAYQKIYKDFDIIADMSTAEYIYYLGDSVPTATRAEYYAFKVKETSQLREVIRVTHTVNSKAYSADMDGISAAELIADLQESLSKNEIIASATGKIPTAKDDWLDIHGRLCQGQKSEYLGLRTGFETLDKATLGLRGLSVLGGIPGQGKSSFALQVACEIARLNNVPVLFYALEMSKFDLYIKAISRLSKLDYTTLTIGSEINKRRGQGLSETDNDKLNKATDGFMEYANRVKIVDRAVCRDISLALVRLHIQQAKREYNADSVFVVIDHLQIFYIGDDKDKQKYDMKQRLDYLVGEFKAISEQLDASILLISEKNRSSYDRQWLGAYMGSAGIEYGVDFAMLLHEPGEEDNRNTEDKGERKIELKVVKNRFGRRADIKMMFYPELSQFVEEEKGGHREPEKTNRG